jgi:4-hydroxy-4-methyl-2-oxoglutarate aldolase
MDDRALAQRLGDLYAGVLYDALHFDVCPPEPFLLDRHIAPIRAQASEVRIAGRAFLCGGERVGNTADLNDLHRLEMLTDMTPGCVQVIAAGGDRACAHFGDVSAALAAAHGAIGAVIDGNTRDARRIVADGFPVFCRDVLPVDAYGHWQLVRHQCEESVDGEDGLVGIAPGDWIFADADGVLRIRQDDVDDVLAAAEDRFERESSVRNRLTREDPLRLYEELGRW